MSIRRDTSWKSTTLVLGFVYILYQVKATPPVFTTNPIIFDVTNFGAIGNGQPDYNEDGESTIGTAFIQAWTKACKSITPSKVLIPKGTFVVAQVTFTGPCQTGVIVELQGNVLADPDISQFPNNELILFEQVENIKFIGPGSINANRNPSEITPMDLDKPFLYMELMPSVKLINATNFVMEGIHSINPESFHVLVDNSNNITISNVNFETDNMKPLVPSDGIFVTMSSRVVIANSRIKSGDSCIAISGGSIDVSVIGVTCVAGQGISVGALPHVVPNYNINGILVKNCTFQGTLYGARINPKPQDALGQVSDVTFQDLVMDQAQNPIFIKQDYAPLPNKYNAKVTNIHFQNIRGTTTTSAAISFSCDKASPCDGIEVADVDLTFTGKSILGKAPGLSAVCVNAQVNFLGKHDGLNCV